VGSGAAAPGHEGTGKEESQRRVVIQEWKVVREGIPGLQRGGSGKAVEVASRVRARPRRPVPGARWQGKPV